MPSSVLFGAFFSFKLNIIEVEEGEEEEKEKVKIDMNKEEANHLKEPTKTNSESAFAG